MDIQLKEYENSKPIFIKDEKLSQQIQKLKAEKKWEQLIEISQKLDELSKFKIQALAYFNLQKWDKLITVSNNGIKISKQSEFYNYKGRAAGAKGKTQQKIIFTKIAIEIDSKVASYHRNLGSAYYRLKKYENALISHAKAIYLQPNNSCNYHNKGATLFRMKKYEAAKEMFKEATEKNKRYSTSFYWIGQCQQQLGDYKAALQNYEVSYEINNAEAIGVAIKKIKKKIDEEQNPSIFKKIKKMFD